VFISVNVAAMVSRLDNSVGQIVGALMETGMLRNSIIVFVSDNGAPSVGIYQNWGSNYPLRGVRVIYILHKSDQGIPIGAQSFSAWLLKGEHSEFYLLVTTLCRPLKINIHFGGKYRFCLQGWGISQARNHHEAGSSFC
jgi:hypothetical protein